MTLATAVIGVVGILRRLRGAYVLMAGGVIGMGSSVMADMLRCQAAFVIAETTHRRPAELERREDE
jgi:hypothetical protein